MNDTNKIVHCKIRPFDGYTTHCMQLSTLLLTLNYTTCRNYFFSYHIGKVNSVSIQLTATQHMKNHL